jgi:flagellar FliL protein
VAKEEEKKDDEAPKEGATDEASGGEDGLGEPPKKSKKKLIIIAAVALLVLGGGGAGLFFSGVLGGKSHPPAEGEVAAGAHPDGAASAAKDGKEAKTGKEGKETKPAFFSLGDIIVNLNSDPKHPNFLKLKVSLELADEKDATALEAMKPRIVDNFQVYLRELRIEDLRGSAGLYRLREELLLRVTEAVQPIRVRDVLFQEMLVQ